MTQVCLKKLSKVPTAQLQRNVTYPASNMQVSGNPKRVSTPMVDFQPGTAGTGFWEAEVGAWNFNYPTDRDEIFHVLQGSFSLEGEGESKQVFAPGDTGVIPAGFAGTMTVIESARKIYVLLPRSDA